MYVYLKNKTLWPLTLHQAQTNQQCIPWTDLYTSKLKKVVCLRIINKIATLPISIVKGDEDSIFSETGTVVVSSVE
jgi:hypothetical protein